MLVFHGVLFLLMGAGGCGVCAQSLRTGWLPMGPNGLRGRFEVRREGNPVGCWLLFATYTGGGGAMALFGLRLLFGLAEPLPLR